MPLQVGGVRKSVLGHLVGRQGEKSRRQRLMAKVMGTQGSVVGLESVI